MKRKTHLLRSPDSGDAGGGADAPAPLPSSDHSAPSAPAPPPAASAVMESGVSEGDAGELVKTKRQLADERAARKTEQTRLSELEDENRRLKSAGLSPHPAPAPAAQKKGWLSGFNTVLDD